MSSPAGQETWHLLAGAHYPPAGAPVGCAVCRQDRRVVRPEPAAAAAARPSSRRVVRRGRSGMTGFYRGWRGRVELLSAR